MRGRARIVYEITAPQPVTEMRLELHSSLTVRSVQAEGAQVSFTRQARRLTLTFSQGLAPAARGHSHAAPRDGDEAFRRTLGTYFQRTRGRPARVDDFREAAEEISGKKLDWFFDQWIMQAVLPDYVVASATSTRTDDGQFRTTATIRNAGTGAMPVDVAFGTGQGRVIQCVDVPSRGEATLSAATPAAVRQVEVDPDKWIIQSNCKNDVFEIR